MMSIITDNSKVNENLLKQNSELLQQNTELLEALKEVKRLGGFDSSGKIGKYINDIIQKHETK